MNKIGDLISEGRKARGLTQAELGARLGISGKAVSKWERGLSKPCAEHLAQLVDLLGLPVEPTTAKERDSMPQSSVLSAVRKECIRILATGVMIAVSLCNLSGMLSTVSTVVSLGFSTALFCLGTMVKGGK